MTKLTFKEKINASGEPIKYDSIMVIDGEKLKGHSTKSLYIRTGFKNKTPFLSQRGQGDTGAGDICKINKDVEIDVNYKLFDRIKTLAEKADAIISIRKYKEQEEEYATGGELQAKKTELEKAEKQLSAAKNNNAPSNVIAFAEKKIARIEAEIKAMEENPEVKEGDAEVQKAKFKVGDKVVFMSVKDKKGYKKGTIKGVKFFKEESEITGEKGYLYSIPEFGDIMLGEKNIRLESELSTSKKAVKKTASKKVKEEEVKLVKSEGDFTVSEKDGATLVASNLNKNWVMTIEPKGGKFEVSCCSEDYNHPKFTSKDKAVAYAKEWLHCKGLYENYEQRAKKIIEARKNYNKKDGEKNVVLTVEKAVETIENKVEKIEEAGENITKADANKIDKSLSRIVATIKVAIKNEADAKQFVQKLINELKKLL